ncbi:MULTISPECIES: hypothetical protein [unclassified Pseudomonas]|jgi:hypothetical protein|uniref:hypothetical protein n=1 Tax=unclassified Pseudomonas TaxID=196821 RepID=UPI001A9D2BDC|nr:MULTISPECIES: hypothetical protein [unclassified Pseudomonas]
MDRTNERIEQLTTLHKESANKLDYFILGATLAICAYLAQTNPYGRIGINSETFLLGSLLVFAASAICGFKRIESTVTSIGLNIFALQHEDPALRQYFLGLLKERKAPSHYYVARNYLLMLGLLVYLITKVWSAYQSHGWIMTN